MEKPIARIGRKNLLNNLVNRLPLLAAIYMAQCLFIYNYFEELNIGDYAMWMGGSLVLFISTIMVFERFHQVIFYKRHLEVSFGFIGSLKVIPYILIEDIIAPEQEYPFATLTLKLKDKTRVDILFTDCPLRTKEFLLKLIQDNLDEQENESLDAA